VVAKARGDASRFLQVLDEYKKAPDVTRDRLYLDALEDVYSNSTKLVIDQKSGGNNVMYLPLDQLIRKNSGSMASTNEEFNLDNLGSDMADTGGSESRQERSSRLRSLTQ
jgi:membrane protease subunit HflK